MSSASELLTRALNDHLRESTRAEDLERYEDFFVDLVKTPSLIGPGAQLIYGRAGTGKTLLIGVLNDRCRGNAKETRIASVSFNAAQFSYSPEYGRDATVRERTHVIFQLFIEALCHEFVKLADELVERPGFLERLADPSGRESKKTKIISLCIDLLDVAKYGVQVGFPNDVREIVDATRGQSSEKTNAVGGMLGLTSDETITLGVKAEWTAGNSHASRVVSNQEKTSTITRRFNPGRVRELICELVDELKLDHLVIFIDEWMTLKDCQVPFAERMKNALLQEKRIAVKIATDQFQAEFNNSGEGTRFRGIDIDRDIFIGVNLDDPFDSYEQMYCFLADALYKRLCVFTPALKEHFGYNRLANREYFVESIFETVNAFHHACRASHGICRDFYEIIRRAFKKLDGEISSTKRIAFHHVRWAVDEMTMPIYTRLHKSPNASALLQQVLQPQVRSTRSRYFAVQATGGEHQSMLRNMLSRRVIHKVRQSLVHPSIRGRYDIYEVNAGIFSQLMLALEYNTGKALDDAFHDEEIVQIRENTLHRYLIDESRFDLGEGKSRVCSQCSKEFLESELAFVRRRICPLCFADQPMEEVNHE